MGVALVVWSVCVRATVVGPYIWIQICFSGVSGVKGCVFLVSWWLRVLNDLLSREWEAGFRKPSGKRI